MGESERKAMARQLEKQGKAVERAAEVEKQLSSQVVGRLDFVFHCRCDCFLGQVDLEKMNIINRRAVDNADKQIRMLEMDLAKCQAQMEAEKKRVADVRRHACSCAGDSCDVCQVCNFASERGVYMRKLESTLKNAVEEVSRTKKEAEKKLKKMSSAVVPTSTREEALMQENEGLWVRSRRRFASN